MSLINRQALLISTLLLMLALIMIPGSSCSPSSANLRIFAAAGAKPAIDEICQKFQEKYGVAVEASYGGGGEALSQMTLSRRGDVYVAPEQRFMEMAAEKQAIDPETVKSVAYMIPVIAVKKGNPKNIQNLADLAKPGIKVAVTRQETTLLGKYAPEIFAKAGLTEEIGKNIITEAARPDNLLTMLIMGQVDAGIIWHFYQVQAPDQIENIYLLPEQLTGIGEIQAAVSAYSQDKKSAQQFIDFITSAEGKAVFKQLGYLVDAEEVKEYWP
ncbi:MAG: molybdate ABC transporter substrate-binding protein [Chloroflexi bacterium RBG_16_50_9]|nr:MAG: molybdate ABC transporter substrate-binding protein [Chloroflexi bacterium RBG_16_50_9]